MARYGNPPQAAELASMATQGNGNNWWSQSEATPINGVGYESSLKKRRIEEAIGTLRKVDLSVDENSCQWESSINPSDARSDSDNESMSSNEGLSRQQRKPTVKANPLTIPPDCVAKYLRRVDRHQPRIYGGNKWDFKPGMIIEAPLHEEDRMYGTTIYAHNGEVPDFAISASHFGYVHTKLRKFVVVDVREKHYLALPMYTHNGNGLENKVDKDEYVSINDARRENQQDWVQLSSHEPLITGTMVEGTSILGVKTTVHVTYPVSRQVSVLVRHLGELEEQGTKRLCSLFRHTLFSG